MDARIKSKSWVSFLELYKRELYDVRIKKTVKTSNRPVVKINVPLFPKKFKFFSKEPIKILLVQLPI